MVVDLYTQKKEKIGEVELSSKVFELPRKDVLVWEAIVSENANLRQGTRSTKTRGEVRGGGRKPWRQKGTGRARHGSIRSPIWVGGGVVFGPKPRDFSIKLPKKKKRLAIKTILSMKAKEGRITVIDKLVVDKDKPLTKQIYDVIIGFIKDELDKKKVRKKKVGRYLVVLADDDKYLKLAMRNIPWLYYVSWDRLSARELLYADRIFMEKDAVLRINEKYGKE